MYNAEVLSKFPVVQHFPFGSLFSFDRDPNAKAPEVSPHVSNHPTAVPDSMPPPSSVEVVPSTKAPWAAPSIPGPPAATGAPRATIRPLRDPLATTNSEPTARPSIPLRDPMSGTGTFAVPASTRRPQPPIASMPPTRAPWASGDPGGAPAGANLPTRAPWAKPGPQEDKG
jgi:serine/threonine-protein phosphatase 2A activator